MVCKPRCGYTAVDHLCLLLAVQFLFYFRFSFSTRWHAVLAVCRHMLLIEPLQYEVPLEPLVKQAALTNLYFDLLFLTAEELFPYFLPVLNLNAPAIFTSTLPLNLQFIHLKSVTVLNNFSSFSYFLCSHWSVANGLQGQQILPSTEAWNYFCLDICCHRLPLQLKIPGSHGNYRFQNTLIQDHNIN